MEPASSGLHTSEPEFDGISTSGAWKLNPSPELTPTVDDRNPALPEGP